MSCASRARRPREGGDPPSRRALSIAGALFGVGLSKAVAQAPRVSPEVCLSPPPPEFSREPGRILTPLDRVPSELLTRPRNPGICAAGGGHAWIPWWVSFEMHGLLEVGRGDGPGPITSAVPRRRSEHLSYPTVQQVLSLADRTWRERRTRPTGASRGYREVLAIRDGTAAYLLDVPWPIRGGAAAELVALLRELARAPR